MSASGRMMFGDLPPSSSVTRLSARPALAPISRPTAVEPVNAILSTPGWSTSAAPVSPSPVTHVEHARREADLQRQLAEAQRRQRRLLGGLEHDRAARRERRAELPRGHQQREVPRHDLPAHADRFAARVAEHVRRGDGQHAALDLRRPAGEVAQVRGRTGRRRRTGRGRPACRCRATRARRAPRSCVFDRAAASARISCSRPVAGMLAHGPSAKACARGGDGAVDVLGAGVRDLSRSRGRWRGRASRRCARRRRRGARSRSAAAAVGRGTRDRRAERVGRGWLRRWWSWQEPTPSAYAARDGRTSQRPC